MAGPGIEPAADRPEGGAGVAFGGGGGSLAEWSLNPPLVSVILVNRDYEAFVGEAIDSIRGQDYPEFECFVVDNASSDGSRAVIARHVAGDPRFTVVHLDENLGQLGAALGVFDRLSGGFVACVDADDILFPNYLSSHLQVHLALPVSVGFTSSNIVEVDAGRNVLTGGRSGFGVDCETGRGLRPAGEVLRLSSISEADYAALDDATRTVPHWVGQWVWAPGTSNMFRKSALDIARPEARLIEGHAGWDNYFCIILHLISGSTLIHRHLSAYRFHGRNSFSNAPRMRGAQPSSRALAARANIQRLHVLRTFVSRAREFNWILAGDRFWSTVDLLAGIEGVTPRAYFARPEAQEVVAEHLSALTGEFGAGPVIARLLERMGTRALWRVLAKAGGGRVPPALGLRFARAAARRRLATR